MLVISTLFNRRLISWDIHRISKGWFLINHTATWTMMRILRMNRLTFTSRECLIDYCNCLSNVTTLAITYGFDFSSVRSFQWDLIRLVSRWGYWPVYATLRFVHQDAFSYQSFVLRLVFVCHFSSDNLRFFLISYFNISLSVITYEKKYSQISATVFPDILVRSS